jgi:hypothetical protein
MDRLPLLRERDPGVIHVVSYVLAMAKEKQVLRKRKVVIASLGITRIGIDTSTIVGIVDPARSHDSALIEPEL